jgi:hypothetical protein
VLKQTNFDSSWVTETPRVPVVAPETTSSLLCSTLRPTRELSLLQIRVVMLSDYDLELQRLVPPSSLERLSISLA